MAPAPPGPYSRPARDRLTAALAARDLDALYTAGMAALDAYDEAYELMNWDAITPHVTPTCSIDGCSSTDVITVPSGNWCARHVVTGGWPAVDARLVAAVRNPRADHEDADERECTGDEL